MSLRSRQMVYVVSNAMLDSAIGPQLDYIEKMLGDAAWHMFRERGTPSKPALTEGRLLAINGECWRVTELEASTEVHGRRESAVSFTQNTTELEATIGVTATIEWRPEETPPRIALTQARDAALGEAPPHIRKVLEDLYLLDDHLPEGKELVVEIQPEGMTAAVRDRTGRDW